MKPGVPAAVLVYDSVTRMAPDLAGRAVIAASHGGLYSVHLALSQGVGGLIVCDAGLGKERAGIVGLALAERLGVPCAAIHYQSARIGDGADCAQRGVISFANACATQRGIVPGMPAMEAASRMAQSHLGAVDPGAAPAESRQVLGVPGGARTVVLIDSASLVQVEDRDAVVVTASHGGLLGGMAETAIKLPVFAALYNDAGVGCDGAGISRLVALEVRGIAGATVAADSACIGDARSAWDSGVISHVNPRAQGLGARVGQSTREWAACMASAV